MPSANGSGSGSGHHTNGSGGVSVGRTIIRFTESEAIFVITRISIVLSAVLMSVITFVYFDDRGSNKETNLAQSTLINENIRVINQASVESANTFLETTRLIGEISIQNAKISEQLLSLQKNDDRQDAEIIRLRNLLNR